MRLSTLPLLPEMGRVPWCVSANSDSVNVISEAWSLLLFDVGVDPPSELAAVVVVVVPLKCCWPLLNVDGLNGWAWAGG